MSAILPPAERLWYKHPIDRVEGTWIAIALIWCLIMFAMMVGWHVWGKQNLSTETYRTTPEMFMAKTQAMVDKYTVRIEKDENATPVVAPMPRASTIMIPSLSTRGTVSSISTSAQRSTRMCQSSIIPMVMKNRPSSTS